MFAKFAVVVTFTLAAILPYVLAYAVNDADTKPVYLATIEGKSYYADQQASMNWTEAKAHCNATGMHLATVTTHEQHDLLMTLYNNVTFNNEFWTGGRDALTATQFAWDPIGTAPDGSIVSPLGTPVLHSCLSLDILSTTDLRFHGKTCATKLAVLCEVIHACFVS